MVFSNRRSGKLIAVLIFWIVILQAAPVASAGSQTWRLLNVNYTQGAPAKDSTDHHKDLFMNNTGDSKSYMDLPSTRTTWWYAGHPAQYAISFGEDSWTVSLYHEKTPDITVYANIYVVNSTGAITYIAGGSRVTNASGYSIIVCNDNSSTSQSLQSGERISLRINSTDPVFRIYYYNETKNTLSCLISPSSDPGYPVPELSSLILLSSGIACIAGIALFSSRRRRK